MSLNKKTLQYFLIFWGVVFTLFIFFYSSSTSNPVIRPRLERIEAFQTKTAVDASVEAMTLEPDDATLQMPRQPYSLLKDFLPQAVERVSPNAKRCYEADFQTRIEKTGNFRQLTNNYKRSEPDSCSSPLHEFVLSYYKPDVLP